MRNPIFISSSDDEDDRSSLRSKRSHQKPKSKSALVTRTNPRQPKRPRKESSDVDEMKLAMEEFGEVLNGFKVSAGRQSGGSKELWVDKYKPRSLEELAVNKKKVEEVKKWFEERLDSTKDERKSCAMIISGPAGVGKSATIHVIASHLGARVCEWNTPTPTVWSEHVHNSNIGISYTSKLDEFEIFVERVRKYGLISPSSPAQLESSVILLIDDFPVTYGRVAFERVKEILVLLVTSVHVPTAILLTDYGNEDSADNSARRLEELQSALERTGAHKVSFNAVTHNSIKKTLSRICRQECCDLTAEQIHLIAQGSGGDIRQAILSLQLFCLKPHPILNLSSSLNTDYERKINELNTSNGGSLLYGRDETLTLFHALGKFLHNKRETENLAALDSNTFSLQEKFSRLPIKMDSPEKILCQAHGQARTVTDFLHENVLDFLSDEAMDDACDVASYLGDADVLLSSYRGMLIRYNEVENILQSTAASVAVRGVLYGNAHPAPSRWHSIRKPKLWQVEQSTFRNQNEIVRHRLGRENQLGLHEASVVATEFTPLLKWLGFRSLCEVGSRKTLVQADGSEEDNWEKMSLDQEGSSISDDDIEDW